MKKFLKIAATALGSLMTMCPQFDAYGMKTISNENDTASVNSKTENNVPQIQNVDFIDFALTVSNMLDYNDKLDSHFTKNSRLRNIIDDPDYLKHMSQAIASGVMNSEEEIDEGYLSELNPLYDDANESYDVNAKKEKYCKIANLLNAWIATTTIQLLKNDIVEQLTDDELRDRYDTAFNHVWQKLTADETRNWFYVVNARADANKQLRRPNISDQEFARLYFFHDWQCRFLNNSILKPVIDNNKNIVPEVQRVRVDALPPSNRDFDEDFDVVKYARIIAPSTSVVTKVKNSLLSAQCPVERKPKMPNVTIGNNKEDKINFVRWHTFDIPRISEEIINNYNKKVKQAKNDINTGSGQQIVFVVSKANNRNLSSANIVPNNNIVNFFLQKNSEIFNEIERDDKLIRCMNNYCNGAENDQKLIQGFDEFIKAEDVAKERQKDNRNETEDGQKLSQAFDEHIDTKNDNRIEINTTFKEKNNPQKDNTEVKKNIKDKNSDIDSELELEKRLDDKKTQAFLENIDYLMDKYKKKSQDRKKQKSDKNNKKHKLDIYTIDEAEQEAEQENDISSRSIKSPGSDIGYDKNKESKEDTKEIFKQTTNVTQTKNLSIGSLEIDKNILVKTIQEDTDEPNNQRIYTRKTGLLKNNRSDKNSNIKQPQKQITTTKVLTKTQDNAVWSTTQAEQPAKVVNSNIINGSSGDASKKIDNKTKLNKQSLTKFKLNIPVQNQNKEEPKKEVKEEPKKEEAKPASDVSQITVIAPKADGKRIPTPPENSQSVVPGKIAPIDTDKKASNSSNSSNKNTQEKKEHKGQNEEVKSVKLKKIEQKGDTNNDSSKPNTSSSGDVSKDAIVEMKNKIKNEGSSTIQKQNKNKIKTTDVVNLTEAFIALWDSKNEQIRGLIAQSITDKFAAKLKVSGGKNGAGIDNVATNAGLNLVDNIKQKKASLQDFMKGFSNRMQKYVNDNICSNYLCGESNNDRKKGLLDIIQSIFDKKDYNNNKEKSYEEVSQSFCNLVSNLIKNILTMDAPISQKAYDKWGSINAQKDKKDHQYTEYIKVYDLYYKRKGRLEKLLQNEKVKQYVAQMYVLKTIELVDLTGLGKTQLMRVLNGQIRSAKKYKERQEDLVIESNTTQTYVSFLGEESSLWTQTDFANIRTKQDPTSMLVSYTALLYGLVDTVLYGSLDTKRILATK